MQLLGFFLNIRTMTDKLPNEIKLRKPASKQEQYYVVLFSNLILPNTVLKLLCFYQQRT